MATSYGPLSIATVPVSPHAAGPHERHAYRDHAAGVLLAGPGQVFEYQFADSCNCFQQDDVVQFSYWFGRDIKFMVRKHSPTTG